MDGHTSPSLYPLAWMSLALNLGAIVVSLILYQNVRHSRSKYFKESIHYYLYSLAVIIPFNRVLHLIHQVGVYSCRIYGCPHSLNSLNNFTGFLVPATTSISMLMALSLTMARLIRMEMLVPGQYIYFIVQYCFKAWNILSVAFSVIVLAIQWILEESIGESVYADTVNKEQYSSFISLFQIRGTIGFVSIASILFQDTWLNLRMIRLTLSYEEDFSNSNPRGRGGEDDIASGGERSRQQEAVMRREKLKLHLYLLFIALNGMSLVDLGIAMTTYSVPFLTDNYEMEMNVIYSSWLPCHIYILLKLLGHYRQRLVDDKRELRNLGGVPTVYA